MSSAVLCGNELDQLVYSRAHGSSVFSVCSLSSRRRPCVLWP
jgi:hypothetical protein